MPHKLAAHFSPALTSAEELADGIVVVIDVLRASTTIAAALAAGAGEVIPLGTVEEARETAAAFGRGQQVPATQSPVLGGERSGGKIAGFDLGNSPSEYTPAAVGERMLIFTTTNGTQALQICGRAKKTLIGAFVNFSAVIRELVNAAASASPLHLLCAGTDRKITREDVLFAGAVADRLSGSTVGRQGLNDEARIAQDVWRQAIGEVEFPSAVANQRLAETLRDTQGGRNLIGIGLGADIGDAAAVDRFDFAPVFDAATRRVTKPD